MNQADFLLDFHDILQRDEPFSMDTLLADMEEWDSLSIMATIAYFDKKYNVALTFDTFTTTRTVGDIASFVPGLKA